jgi:N,N'-diacetyllegionaminate synthase
MTPYILAEIASAHMGDPELCMQLIHRAQESGADGVKVQIWNQQDIRNHPSFNNLKRFELTHQEWGLIAELAKRAEIDLWVEVYGKDSAKFATTLEPHAWKIPYTAVLSQPPIMDYPKSTVYLRVQTQAVDFADHLAIGEQHYPTTYTRAKEEIKLIKHYKGKDILYADHEGFDTKAPGYAAIRAHHAGANIIEKHICLNREVLKGESKDYISALEPKEFKRFVDFMKKYERGGKVRMLV